MESLLSVSFDNLASRDLNKIRKGLRQIDGLLAQICLSPASRVGASSPSKNDQNSSNKRRQSLVEDTSPDSESALIGAVSSSPDQTPCSASHQLAALSEDLAFLEFFRLQESFEWNVTTRLVQCLERLLGLRNNSQTTQLIAATLDLIHGMLLLHPRSRALFNREIHQTLLLDLLDPEHSPLFVLSSCVSTLLTALLDQPRNTRLFESLDGLATVATLCQSSSVMRDTELQNRLAEFLHFYMLPEAANPIKIDAGKIPGTRSSNGATIPENMNQDASLLDLNAVAGRTDEKLASPRKRTSKGHQTTHSWTSTSSDGTDIEIKQPEEKRALLERVLGCGRTDSTHSQKRTVSSTTGSINWDSRDGFLVLVDGVRSSSTPLGVV